MVVSNVSSLSMLEEHVASGVSAVNFTAPWAGPCKQMDAIFSALSDQKPGMKFLVVQAEEQPEITEKFNVSSVPAFLFFENGKNSDSAMGANPAELSALVEKYGAKAGSVAVSNGAGGGGEGNLEARLKGLIKQQPVMLFMKGVPSEPRCGFSRTIVGILNEHKIKFGSFDILEDEEVRQGLKKFSSWPTYPQLYANGELIGGLDIIKELVEDGELEETLAAPEPKSLEERLKDLTKQAPVMLFMKGNPAEPRCGFSKTIVGILNEQGIKFGSFDILSDEEVRQGLKKFSNWPTYPQLYANGTLVGGLDIVKELVEEDSLKEELGV